MTVIAQFYEHDYERLSAFLASEPKLTGTMSVSMLEGFLTALVIGPKSVPPAEWLPWIWDPVAGDQMPEFADKDVTREGLCLIIALLNRVAEAFGQDPVEFKPVFTGQDLSWAEQWCEGFLVATKHIEPETWAVLWFPPQGPDEASAAIAGLIRPFSRLGTDEGRTLSAADGDAQHWVDLIVPNLVGIHDFWRVWNRILHEGPEDEWELVQQPFRRDTSKVGRNDPCPCGSGRKFKKCCGQTTSSP